MFQPPEKGERGYRTKKTNFEVTQVDINAEANIGKVLMADSLYVDSRGYPKDFVYMITNYGDFTSEKKSKQFPFHVKTYLVNQN